MENNTVDNNVKVVSVKFSNYSSAKEYLIKDSFKIGDPVLIFTLRGQEIGNIVSKLNKKPDYKIPFIQGKPTENQLKIYENFHSSERRYIDEAQQLANNLNLQMNFIGCERTLEQKTVYLYFESENRVDFRQLLRDLANNFSARIELTQIGSRVSAGFIGGLGICGHSLCCSTFLKKFDTVTLNKAKNQNLSLNTQKLSGKCGRLKCCLSYEDDIYTEEKKHLPSPGKKFKKDGKEFTITSVNILNKTFRCESENQVELLPLEELKKYLRF